jgi:Flp pilus assembly protein TadG
METIFKKLIRRTDGVSAILTALCIVALLGMVSLALDLGQLYTVRNSLQNNADGAALAAVGNLVQDYGAGAVRDAGKATQSAMTVVQTQSQLSGQSAVADAARNDLTIIFGTWDDRAGNAATAWTPIGTTCGSGSTANAVQVTIVRGSGTVYGPVSNFFAGILGIDTAEVAATAIAYLGYTDSTPAGAGPPLALPDTVLHAAKPGNTRWWASLFAPKEAIASSPTTLTFQDLGSDTFYQSNLNQPQFNSQKAYMVLVNSSDPVPNTIIDNLNSNYGSGTPIRPIAQGSRLYPLSEYQWASNIKTIFQSFQAAYNAKKNPVTGKWRVIVPIYSTHNPLANRLQKGLEYLARLMPFSLSQAHACFEFWNQGYPGGNVPIYVNGFANVDITNVNYVPTCDDCSKYSPAKDGKKYLNTLDCMVKSALSCRNANTVTVEVPTASSTVSPPGTQSGGPSNQNVNPGATPNTGPLANIPRLVK